MAVGHASDHEAETGCTVVLGPFRAAVDVRGLASGTRQLDSLSPSHVIPEVDALLLTGGSAYGLAAADGVASWLEERGRGFATSAAKVAIVPTAVIFDLGRGRADRRPDAEMGHAACEAASDAPVKEGRVGVGSGASVGKLLGPGGAMPSGVASWGGRCGSYTVGALAVVNAFGDVVNGRGEIIAGARGQGGAFIDTASYLRENDPPAEFGRQAGTNTSLAIVATDCPLSRAGRVRGLAQHPIAAMHMIFVQLGAGQVECAALPRPRGLGLAVLGMKSANARGYARRRQQYGFANRRLAREHRAGHHHSRPGDGEAAVHGKAEMAARVTGVDSPRQFLEMRGQFGDAIAGVGGERKHRRAGQPGVAQDRADRVRDFIDTHRVHAVDLG